MLKKVNAQMYCLRKLRSFGVNSGVLVTFYNAVILALLCMVLSVGVGGGNISKFDRGRLENIVKNAGHVGMPLDSFKTL